MNEICRSLNSNEKKNEIKKKKAKNGKEKGENRYKD